MPQLVRLYIQSVVIGFAVAAAFVAILVWQDVMGVGHLILGSSSGAIAAAMLVVFNGIVFAGVQFGLRVMLMAGPDEGPKGGLRAPDVRPVPVTVAAPSRPARARR